uniref:Flagellar associated protein putative n=1 Tax=Albugo laibachii Nc14 TaxID=890382 RepID=F0WMC0_9STRA|nr:flagellar associated protein putative [Albugo laibachii Nc14]|eukprot:CCA22451.1 flagellar associated protein putative [Albugo laibachii Nc14]
MSSGEQGSDNAIKSKNEMGSVNLKEAEVFDPDQLENDFQEVMTELMGDKSLERFRVEYEKLHNALTRASSQEKRLIKKCRELNAEIINNAAKVQTAIKLSQEDQSSIASLKKEMEKAWKMVDASHEKELRAKETVQQLKDEITNLSRLVDQGAGLNTGKDNLLKESIRAKEEISQLNGEYKESLKKEQIKLQDFMKVISENEAAAMGSRQEMQNLQDQLAIKIADQERDQRRKERMEKEMKEFRAKYEKKVGEQVELNQELAGKTSQIQLLEKDLQETRGTLEKYVRDYESLFSRSQKLADLLNDQSDKTMQLEVERRSLQKEIKSQQIELHRIRLEKSVAERKIDKEKRIYQKLEERLDHEHTTKLVLQSQIGSMQKDLDNEKVLDEKQQAEMDRLEREKKMERRNVEKAEAKANQAHDDIQANERIEMSLRQELAGLKREAAKQRKLIYQLEKGRERYEMEATEQRKLLSQSEEDGKAKLFQIEEAQKKVLEMECKLKQQQQLYEQVRSERNHCSKNLNDSRDEISELKRKFTILNHQIEQLKEEVATKDDVLVKEHFQHCKVEKEKDLFKNELGRLHALVASNETTIHHQDAELKKMSAVMRGMDDEALKQRKEYDQIIHERDILGTQLIRRNDELSLLYEKLRIQQSILSKGEAQYQERMQDTRVLKLKVTDLKRELHIAKHQVGQWDDLKREVFHLQRALLQEKTKVKALSEELENPMNVHRWRKLEGNDPATYELLQKVQTLQKRLIQKTEQVVEKDLMIQEKEKLYNELKVILARQPGPEVVEQLSWYQQVVRDKEKQLKMLLSEQNMFQSTENELKFQIERLSHEINEYKRKYYKKKLEDKIRRTKSNNNNTNCASGMDRLPTLPQKCQLPGRMQPAQAQRQLALASTTRYVGGGFSLNQ